MREPELHCLAKAICREPVDYANGCCRRILVEKNLCLREASLIGKSGSDDCHVEAVSREQWQSIGKAERLGHFGDRRRATGRLQAVAGLCR